MQQPPPPEPGAAPEKKEPRPIPTSVYNEEIKRRGQEAPIARSRLLPIEQRFEAICNTLRRSGIALSITVDAKEEQLKVVMPKKLDLRCEDPFRIIMELQDLELGDVVAIGLANDCIYYLPQAAPNIYNDPLKREPFAKIREDEEKALVAFARKHKGNLPIRIADLEKKVLHLSGLEKNLERADHAIRELMKMTKQENNFEDVVQAMREEVADMKQYALLVPSVMARLESLERSSLVSASLTPTELKP